MKQSFEDYLKWEHAENNPQVLDDDLSDDYEKWLTELDPDEWIKYADDYKAFNELVSC